MVFSIEPKIINPPKNRHDYQLSEAIRYRAWVEIDRSAIQQNVRKVKALLAPKTELMAVIKADAYGHGAVKVANSVLEAGAQSLAIATIGEGIELREAGIVAPIMILGAVNTPEEVAALAHWQLQPTLVQIEQVQIFASVMRRLEQRLPVHIKLDTGMSRLGTQWQNGTKFVEQVLEAPNLKIASIYSHFATADDPNPEIMQLQRQRFQQAIAELRSKGYHPPCLHLANSAATLSDRSLHYDRVRVGLALYGLYPADHLTDKVPLQPVLQVKARIAQVKTIAAGSGVSYGHQYIAAKDTRIAVVGIGYADGIPRNLSNRLKVSLRGRLVPQIGAITMDQLMIDVSEIPEVKTGEIVTLIGKDGPQCITADDWARDLGTISWEILCGFKHRLPRIIISNG
ncbi:alanine racemase [Microcystis viridis NIES-102]|uniref:Alanine racemase n=1 Tax=Microcystis viridis NIES-102 TaxID=213615 RepID=A0A3G9K392_MICVR|nr:alanine racemase [Microcystis viridis]BBH39675.1 alanine racemase [Microcystis viridis NIES-102]